jgi:UTP--glucose-1-phosphate uridylyltransferase
VRSIQPDDMDCAFVRQPRSLGLGHAVLCAEPLVGNEPFAVLLADDLMVGPPAAPVLAQMTAAFRQQGRSLIGRAGSAARAGAPLRHRGRANPPAAR